jgi:hypothetical protein
VLSWLADKHFSQSFFAGFGKPVCLFPTSRSGRRSCSSLARCSQIVAVGLSVQQGALIAFQSLVKIDGGVETGYIRAYPGAVLDLSAVRYMEGPSGGALQVYADAGALVNLSGVTNIIGNSYVGFHADTNVVIDLSGLLTLLVPVLILVVYAHSPLMALSSARCNGS